jgi:type III secretion protein O
MRQLREEAAATECSAREKTLLAARQETQARRKTLEEYLVWRKEEEDRRYREILGKDLSRKEMDAFKGGVAALREKDAILMEALEEAQKAEQEASRRRDEAMEALKRRRKDREKIDVHREIWQVGEAREAERREDLEMEEFTGVKRPEMEEDSDD